MLIQGPDGDGHQRPAYGLLDPRTGDRPRASQLVDPSAQLVVIEPAGSPERRRPQRDTTRSR